MIIGLGGGSILDVSKMAAALVTNPGPTKDYFGKEKVPKRGTPTIIVPTTAGTGAEVTKHAIFLDREINYLLHHRISTPVFDKIILEKYVQKAYPWGS